MILRQHEGSFLHQRVEGFFFLKRTTKPVRSVGAHRALERSYDFKQIKKIPYQDQLIQLGPENVHFWKTHFGDPKIDTRIFTYYKNLDQYQAQNI